MLSKVFEVSSRLVIRKSVIQGSNRILLSASNKFKFAIKSDNIFRKSDKMTYMVCLGSSLTPDLKIYLGMQVDKFIKD